MKANTLIKTLLISILFFSFFSSANADGTSTQATTTIQETTGIPERLTIPRIGVDAPVESVGVTTDGAMMPPKYRNDVAWFQSGVRPGDNGSAVIAGHYGWRSLLVSAFDRLHQLQIGDRIYVEDVNGKMMTFVVRDLRRYGDQSDASEVFFSIDGKPHLNLITCDGRWNSATKSYSSRLVVFTDIAVE